MKGILLVTIIAILLGVLFFIQKSDPNFIGNKVNNTSNSPNQNQPSAKYLFVPYWTFSDSIDLKDYDNVIYFGLSIDENGIDKSDQGYLKLKSFSDASSLDGKKYLTLSILGGDMEKKFLEDISLQRGVGQELRELAVSNGFDGVVVDFETSAFGFSSTQEKITVMYRNLAEEIKKSELEFIITIFGDTYYRARPYNVSEISQVSDKVIIMAYDFHKARLNPGPNFPFSGKNDFGYDFKSMIEDFERDVSHEKITVALGFFGYDWKLDNSGVSVDIAEPLSLNQINSRFIFGCDFENCRVKTNNDLERNVNYVDDEGFSHEVWFESIESADKKIEYLKDRGINQTAYWAYSYF